MDSAAAAKPSWSNSNRPGSVNRWSISCDDADSDDEPTAMEVACDPPTDLATQTAQVQSAISGLEDTSKPLTVARFGAVCKSVAELTVDIDGKNAQQLGSVCLLINQLFNTVAKRDDAHTHLASKLEEDRVCGFLHDQIRCPAANKITTMASNSVDAKHYETGIRIQTIKKRSYDGLHNRSATVLC